MPGSGKAHPFTALPCSRLSYSAAGLVRCPLSPPWQGAEGCTLASCLSLRLPSCSAASACPSLLTATPSHVLLLLEGRFPPGGISLDHYISLSSASEFSKCLLYNLASSVGLRKFKTEALKRHNDPAPRAMPGTMPAKMSQGREAEHCIQTHMHFYSSHTSADLFVVQ